MFEYITMHVGDSLPSFSSFRLYICYDCVMTMYPVNKADLAAITGTLPHANEEFLWLSILVLKYLLYFQHSLSHYNSDWSIHDNNMY